MDPLFGLIQVSSSIKIKRSDGRVHLAKVVQLSPDSKSVGVEWNEHGEVKGKEILLDLVFELNNELRPNTSLKQSTVVVNQQVRPTAAIPVPSNGLSSSRLTLDIDSLEREYNSRPPPALPPQLFQRIQQNPVSIQTTSTPLPPPTLNGYDNYLFLLIFLFFIEYLVQSQLQHHKKQVVHHPEQIILLLSVQFVVLLVK
jgi:hypothetical protein